MTATRVGYTTAVNNAAPSAPNNVLLDPTTGVVGDSIATGMWMVAVVASLTPGGTPITPPSGWTALHATQTAGSLTSRWFVRQRQSGDTTYEFALGGNAHAKGALMWFDGAADFSEWVVGAVGLRPVNGTSTTSVAPGLTSPEDDCLIITIGTERTGAAESGISGATNASEWFWRGHGDTGSSYIETIWVGHSTRDAGSTPDVTITYPNTQANNGIALQVAIPSDEPEPPEPEAVHRWTQIHVAGQLSASWETDADEVVMLVDTDPEFSDPVVSDPVEPTANGMALCIVTGLDHGTVYHLGVAPSDDQANVMATAEALTIHPARIVGAHTTGTGSCQATGSNTPLWDVLAAELFDFLVHQGDMHYADTTVESTWRNAWSSSMNAPRFKALLGKVGMNWSVHNHDWHGSNTDRTTIPGGSFVPDVVREEAAGWVDDEAFYTTWVHRGVRHIHLDCYSQRDPQNSTNSPTKQQLGPAQEAWFIDLLENSPELVIVVYPQAPMRMIGGRWGSYPHETGRIGDAIAALPEHQRSKIVFVGADSHDVRAGSGQEPGLLFDLPNLNASPFDQSGSPFDEGDWWDIALISPASGTRHYYSRLTFTDDGESIDFLWEAVDDAGTTVASWGETFSPKPPPGPPQDWTLAELTKDHGRLTWTPDSEADHVRIERQTWLGDGDPV